MNYENLINFKKEIIFSNFIQDNYDTTNFTILGQGGFGMVISGICKKMQNDWAIKILFPEKDLFFPEKIQELSFQYLLRNNPHIVKVVDSFFDSKKNYLIIVMEKANCNLVRFIRLNSLSKLFILQILSDIIHALNSSHKKKIFHNDVRPSNILVYEVNDRDTYNDIQKLNIYSKEIIFKLSDWGSANLKGVAPGYSPPEINNENFDSDFDLDKVDIYQLGFSLLETMRVPFEKFKKIGYIFNEELHNKEIDKLLKEFEIESKFGKRFSDIIRKMTKYSPNERCNLNELQNFLIYEVFYFFIYFYYS